MKFKPINTFLKHLSDLTGYHFSEAMILFNVKKLTVYFFPETLKLK